MESSRCYEKQQTGGKLYSGEDSGSQFSDVTFSVDGFSRKNPQYDMKGTTVLVK